ncbi:hypothetical protein B0T14DRAFT_39301 [Immersiella caudata]|uniref:Uncharacterized protein n=1 Tax=Immersiella caudata TaxID=314043 RepID=A0AA39XGD1_9PEZI|nr:hypothetical protein B0T14DRAFT_39301 [Immersiella caudata]
MTLPLPPAAPREKRCIAVHLHNSSNMIYFPRTASRLRLNNNTKQQTDLVSHTHVNINPHSLAISIPQQNDIPPHHNRHLPARPPHTIPNLLPLLSDQSATPPALHAVPNAQRHHLGRVPTRQPHLLRHGRGCPTWCCHKGEVV